jgi:GxxExxY protein
LPGRLAWRAWWRQATAREKKPPASPEKFWLTIGGTMEINDLTGEVIGAAIEVHKALGPGLLESTYEERLCIELGLRNVPYERQKEIPIEYKGVDLGYAYRLDIVVPNELIVELKACESLEPIHEAQLLTYLKLSGIKVGLLINFNVPVLKDGVKRLVN